MSDHGVEWKVGMTVLGAIFVFVAGVIFLSESYRARDEIILVVEFDRAGGIQEGDAVRVSGVKMGSVDMVELGDRSVRLTLKLQEDTILYWDSRFRIEAFGLMGEMMVAIDPGTGGNRLDPTAILQGTFSAGFGGTMAEAAPLLEDVRRMIARMERLIDEEQMVLPLEETLGNLRSVSAELETILGENAEDIRSSIASGRASAEKVDRLIGRNETDIDSSIATIRNASGQLLTLVKKLQVSAEAIDGIVGGVEAGRGSLGKLAKDDAMHDEFLRTLENVNLLIDDIRENPGRYLKLEIF